MNMAQKKNSPIVKKVITAADFQKLNRIRMMGIVLLWISISLGFIILALNIGNLWLFLLEFVLCNILYFLITAISKIPKSNHIQLFKIGIFIVIIGIIITAIIVQLNFTPMSGFHPLLLIALVAELISAKFVLSIIPAEEKNTDSYFTGYALL